MQPSSIFFFASHHHHHHLISISMALPHNIIFVSLYLLCPLINRADSSCPSSFDCGSLGTLEFPLSNTEHCGLFMVRNCTSESPLIQFGASGGSSSYYIKHKMSENKFLVHDPTFPESRSRPVCHLLRNLSLPVTPYVSFTVTPNLTMFCCTNRSIDGGQPEYFEHMNCSPFQFYYRRPNTSIDHSLPGCSAIQVPINSSGNPNALSSLLTSEYAVEWNVSEACSECHNGGGQCFANHLNQFLCHRDDNRKKVMIASIASGGGFLLVMSFVGYILCQHKKRMKEDYILSRSISFGPSSKSDAEGGSFYFGIPIFSYTELEEATNNFNQSKELGDGGFGTVYHGKLRDGREVAIKRLYEHNLRRMEQFMNEIKILTTLRHPNLVSLYGCTSRRSRELLLVYEYVPNGTVADHLHGDLALEAPLHWPTRMRIALETATSLAYLHSSGTIHRDVKTNNILLDASFHVKVADFGLSRLFPNDATHVSTAPQGTPGYVDPEYHQCYQLTDKSDVCSFGVVLVELISSLLAVDITRHKHEINLANLAVDRIQRCAFDELIDPALSYETDADVARMTRSVAELAFRCLQPDKDMRPSMAEVVEYLREVQGQGCEVPPSPETEEAVLLKDKDIPASPTAVMDVWISGSSTNSSCVS